MNMISVVIPLYNKERSIVSTIESVLAQTYKDWELIIVDDGSTDNSLEVVRSFIKSLAPSFVMRVIHKENGGVSSARNRGIQEAKSEYVALLDADDLWDKEYLSEQVKMTRDFSDAAMWGINYAEMYKGKLVRKLATGLADEYRGYVENYFQLQGRKSDLFCSSSVVIRKEVFDKIGLFDERIKYAEDSDMWYRIIATHNVAFYNRYMVFYQWDAENRSTVSQRPLRFFLPYYVDKFRDPLYRRNEIFYRWINTWCAQWIARFLFEEKAPHADAYEAAEKLEYHVIPFKYRLLFKMPYFFGALIYRTLQRLKN